MNNNLFDSLISFVLIYCRNEDTQLVALRIVKSLLPKLQPSDIEYLLSALNDLILHPSIKCRKLTYDLYMWIYDNYR